MILRLMIPCAQTKGRGPTLPALVLSSAVLLGGVEPSEALAFKCSRVDPDRGPSLIWNQRAIPWAVNSHLTRDIEDHGRALAQIRGSFEAWENVDCSDVTLPFRGEIDGLRASFEPGQANVNAVVFVDSGWKDDPSVIALTTSAYNTSTGLVVDSDIELNNERFRFIVADASCDPGSNAMDLRNALTHEVGHLLGLDHPPDTKSNTETTMFARAPACETKKRTLEKDDLAGLCAIYPAGAPSHPCFLLNDPSFAVVKTDDGFGCTTTSGGSSLLGLAGSCALGLFLRTRKRN